MSATVKRGAFRRSCRRCPWAGTYDTAAKGNYAKSRHSCARWSAKAASAERGLARDAAVDRSPKPCLHKVADHQHGTYACYTLDACRCPPCAAAVSAYETERIRQQAYGRWDNLVDAEPARVHVRRLMAAGMGLKRISAVGDVAAGVMWKLLYGRPGEDGTRVPSKRLTKAVAARLLAVELDLADGALVDSTHTTRRLQALVANGWSMSKLGARLGVTPGNFNPTINGTRSQVTVATAKAVHALYVELAEQAPPEGEWRERIAASRARNCAASRGWAKPITIAGRLYVGPVLPLPADDDEELTEVVGAHAHDEAAVLRRLDGDTSVDIDLSERIEIVRRARAAGWSYLDIERRAGVNKPERYMQNTADLEAS